MKLEEYIESIFGCLERIENKINGLSVPLPEGNSPTVNNEKEKDESVLNEVLKGHETFRKLLTRVVPNINSMTIFRHSVGRNGFPAFCRSGWLFFWRFLNFV